MDMQIEKYAKEYAKDRAFAKRLLINVIGIVVLITMTVSYSIAKIEDEPTESTSIEEDSLDNPYVLDYGQVDTGRYEADTSSYVGNASSHEGNAGSYGGNVGGYDGNEENYEDIGSCEESIDNNEENMEKYLDSVEDFLRYDYEGDVDDLLKCTGTYTHTKISDITLDINIYSDPSGNEVGTFEISDTKYTYSGVINIGDKPGKYKMKVEDGFQYTMVFYTDGTDYYIYIHSMLYLYGNAESGLLVLTEAGSNTNGDASEIVNIYHEGWNINSAIGSNDELYYDGISATGLMGLSAVEIILDYFGEGYYADDNGRISYNDIEFDMADDETVNSIWIWNIEKCSINGEPMKVNSDGVIESETIINLFGQDYEDEWLDIGYFMSYHYPEYTLLFEVNKFSEICRIIMQRNFSGVGTSLDYEIEAYDISGAYVGMGGNSTASVSMYSSGEEDGVVGNISLLLDSRIFLYGGVLIEGQLVRQDTNWFCVQYKDAEVLLNVNGNNAGDIMIDLYINGEFVESFIMTEQYIS